MSETAIKLTNVSKRFKLYSNPITGPMKELLFFWNRKRYYEEFMAIRNLSLEVKKGEVVGIIGPNGAGKTTLLKMIAGLLPVNQGTIDVNGKVTALLALGVGVHPEFTGRDNIFYHGMLLGMSKEEVLRKMPETIEFAELGDYIDRPFRTYSSGMKARLLFASSMSIDPDILIVDEALATGDSSFVQKSSQKIGELCSSGATILYVSHNLNQIQQICQRALLMVEGRIVNEGEPSRMIGTYNQWVFEKEKRTAIISENTELQMISGTGEVVITDVKLKNAQGEEMKGFYSGENMDIEIYYQSSLGSIMSLNLFVGFVLTKSSSYVGEINTVNYIEPLSNKILRTKIDIERSGFIKLAIEPLLLLNNHYALWMILYDDQQYYCEYRNISPFFVSRGNNAIMRGDATFWQPCKITTG